MENKIVIDLNRFVGKSPRELKTHIEQTIANIKCYVDVPGRNQKIRRFDFRLSNSINVKVEYEDYNLVEIKNEN